MKWLAVRITCPQLLGYTLLLMGFLLFVGGCAQFDSGVAAGTSKAADVTDRALGASVYYMCNGASIGAVRRRFGASPEAYRALCETKDLGVLGDK